MQTKVLAILTVVTLAAGSVVFENDHRCRSENIDDLLVYNAVSGNKTQDSTTSCRENQDGGSLVPRQTYQNSYKDVIGLVRSVAEEISNENCREKLLEYALGLENLTLWAVSMYDSTFKTPVGLVSGNTYQLGHYDQCIKISLADLRGQYCLAEAVFEPKHENYPLFFRSEVENAFSLEYDPYKSAWERFIVTIDPSKKIRNKIYLGICVPDKCTNEDTEIGLNLILKKLLEPHGVNVNVTVREENCSSDEPKSLTTPAAVLGRILSFFAVAVLLSTAWDMIRNRELRKLNKLETVLESFSAYNNLVKLNQPDNTSEMKVFHGMKTLSMVLIIMGHRCATSYGGPFFNPGFLEERYRKFQDMLLLNGTLIVDTFFLIGGYLTSFMICSELAKNKKVSVPMVYLSRWLRMVPVYMLVVFFYAHLFEYIGDGPIWRQKIGREAQRCRDNWWTNLFFVNNYVNVQNMCIFQSWYIACDMHFTLLAPIMAITMMRKPRKGLVVLGLVLAAATAIPFMITYIYKYDGVMRLYLTLFEDIQKDDYFNQVYVKTHNRAFAYFLGMGAAYLHLYLKKINYKFSNTQRQLFSWLAAISAVGSIMGAWMFYIPGRLYDPLENALYCSLHRVLWALSMAWIPIAAATNTFGILQPLLERQIFVPLSRLCFSAFLVHSAVQHYMRAIVRTPEYMTFPKMFWMVSADCVYTFIIALLVHLLFEAPINNLLKVLLFPNSKKGGMSTEVVKDEDKVKSF